ncbi:hypothetical protein Moror_2701 [Moniliophthora roreri MCA 2997]|uniref:Uncharacterized protein n=1 Tax=Moniliophthora roreri (strain MCA 2997) TaxID=1381753 RepID=V2WX35_MONRO|nr:hypothetical protein Moror_2701 [Moniliophthora roreri MCA 2997]
MCSSTLAYYGIGLLGILSIISYFSTTTPWEWLLARRGRAEATEQLLPQIQALREALQQKEDDLAELRKAFAIINGEVQSKQATLDRVMDEVERVRVHSETQLVEARDRNVELGTALHAHTREVSLARDESQRLRIVNEQLQAAVNATFLAERDRLTDDDVVRFVRSLNGEIRRASGLLVDTFMSEIQRPHMEKSKEVHEAMDYTKELLGEKMADMIKNVGHRGHALLLRISFQASMCAWVEWIITSWAYRGREEENIFQDIYDELREREEQHTSAQWRILTRKYIRQALRGAPQADLSDYFFDAFFNILIAAGLPSADSLVDRLRHLSSTHVAAVIDNAIQLNTVIGDSTTSCELVPIICETGTLFDETSMEDALVTQGATEELREPRADESVLCTTDLGLLKSVKVVGREGEWTHRILLKPKVILHSAFGSASPIS